MRRTRLVPMAPRWRKVCFFATMLLAVCIAVGFGETMLAGESDSTWLALALLPLTWIVAHATVVGRSSVQHAFWATASGTVLAAVGAVKADDPAVLTALAIAAGMAAAVLWGQARRRHWRRGVRVARQRPDQHSVRHS